MEAQQTQVRRPAEDIAENIASLIRSFQPLWQSRHAIHYAVGEDGNVAVSGNIKSPVGHRVLVDNVDNIPGVTAVDTSELFNDADLRREIMHKAEVPATVWLNVDFGVVIISGTLPPRRKPEALVKRIEAVKGVRSVINHLSK